jgi:carbon monoxide dehydrogenase subunit G
VRAAIAIAVGLLTAAPSDPSGGVAVCVSVLEDGAYRVEGRFTVRASGDEVWRLLSDYEHLTALAPSLGRSRVTRRDGKQLLVLQESVVRAYLVSKRIKVLLEISEEPPRVIRFKDISGADFERYSGEWRIEVLEEGVQVSYRLDARQRFAAPRSVALPIARESATRLLTEVRGALAAGGGK